MIPLSASVKSRRFPIMNTTIIFINFLIFLQQVQLSPEETHQLVNNYGAIPAEFVGGITLFLEGNPQFALLLPGATLSLFTSIFLHGGWLHLLGNMIYLWVFGDSIEDRLGSLRYLGVYLFMGAGGSLFHILFNPLSDTPLVGASGAIAGVLGIYFLTFPQARVLTLLPLGFFITFIYVPAILFLGLWFLLQLLNAVGAQALDGSAQAVAWWAHVGGFLLGVLIAIHGQLAAKKR